jgi:hypothetical protein
MCASPARSSEVLNELSAAVAIPDEGMNLPIEQIDPGQQTERAMALVFVVTREGGANTRHGRQVRGCRCDGMDTWFSISHGS